MNWLLLCRILGLLGMLIGGAMVFSLPWAFPALGQAERFESEGFLGLLASIGCAVGVGGGLFYLGRRAEASILRKEALAIVGLGWLLAGILGALPYIFSMSWRSSTAPMTLVDALFESVSGFTTTGASVITELEDPRSLPRCVLFWRSFTHWLGGMGIIVLFVALLGHLGAGGKALMRREVPGPISETVRPRIRETAILMWLIYVGLSLLLVVVLMLEGMTAYDALCHSFGTMATGGFSTRNQSIGAYQSSLIEATIVVFMVLAGTNFTLYYLGLHHQDESGRKRFRPSLKPFLRDPEFRMYLGVLLAASLALGLSLWSHEVYSSWTQIVRHSVFTAVSIMTTTGFGTEDFTRWSEFSKGLLLVLMFMGGCAGSTAGGLKVIRWILFFKILRLEIEQAFRPNVVRPLRVAKQNVENALRHEVMVYFALILLIAVGAWIALIAVESDTQWPDETRAEKMIDCASAVAATLNNIGPGVGVIGPHSNYAVFTPAGKLILTMLMLLGRLELFAILVLFLPTFWRSQ